MTTNVLSPDNLARQIESAVATRGIDGAIESANIWLASPHVTPGSEDYSARLELLTGLIRYKQAQRAAAVIGDAHTIEVDVRQNYTLVHPGAAREYVSHIPAYSTFSAVEWDRHEIVTHALTDSSAWEKATHPVTGRVIGYIRRNFSR